MVQHVLTVPAPSRPLPPCQAAADCGTPSAPGCSTRTASAPSPHGSAAPRSCSRSPQFARDRRRDDREQIDKTAAWASSDYENGDGEHVHPPDAPRHIDLYMYSKNANDVPVEVAYVLMAVETNWIVDRGGRPYSEPGTTTLWTSFGGSCRDRARSPT